jgi:Arc/MetJ-type ribon-helix-helix transcriptional regulator
MGDTAELRERLLNEASFFEDSEYGGLSDILHEAATALEAAEAERDALKTALRDLIQVADAASWAANTSMMDDALDRARATVKP